MPRWARLLAGLVFEIASAALVAGVPGAWLLRHMDLARFAAGRASAATGRDVTVGSLRVGWGRTLTLELTELSVPNAPEGSQPVMVGLQHATALLDARSLLHGPLLLRQVAVDGLSVFLEHPPGREPNWRFGPPKPPPPDPTGRTAFPSIRDVVIRGSAITFHTGGGKDLVSRFDDATIETAGDDQPVTVAMTGSYNAVPVAIHAELQPITALRDARTPYGTGIVVLSGETRLAFDGTMTDPLNFDGLHGELRLDAPDPKPIFGMAGVDSTLDVALHLDGEFEHAGPSWRLMDGKGQLQQDEITAATLGFVEGARGQPDRVELDLGLATLNMNDLIGQGARGKRSGADLPLTVERDPDTLVKARITAKTLEYSELRASDVTLAGSQEPGRVSIDVFTLQTFGANVRAEGQVEAAPDGARIAAAVSASGLDVQTLRQKLGFGSIPVTGRLDGQLTVDASGARLNAAIRAARVNAVIALRGGSVAKEVIEMASTDVRALFRTNKGLTPVTCMLAGLDMRGGVGTVAPLRLRAAEGTIAGSGRFDLFRRTMDVTIGSQSKTTGIFALDIPVRVSGTFSTPIVSPAKWTAQGRALLAAADNLGHLPPAMQAFARRSACSKG